MPEPCAWLLYNPGVTTPSEFCEDDAVEGEPYCAEHGRMIDD